MSSWQQVSKKKHVGRKRHVLSKASSPTSLLKSDKLRFDISQFKKNQDERREKINLDDPRVQLVRQNGAKEVIVQQEESTLQSKKQDKTIRMSYRGMVIELSDDTEKAVVKSAYQTFLTGTYKYKDGTQYVCHEQNNLILLFGQDKKLNFIVAIGLVNQDRSEIQMEFCRFNDGHVWQQKLKYKEKIFKTVLVDEDGKEYKKQTNRFAVKIQVPDNLPCPPGSGLTGVYDAKNEISHVRKLIVECQDKDQKFIYFFSVWDPLKITEQEFQKRGLKWGHSSKFNGYRIRAGVGKVINNNQLRLLHLEFPCELEKTANGLIVLKQHGPAIMSRHDGIAITYLTLKDDSTLVQEYPLLEYKKIDETLQKEKKPEEEQKKEETKTEEKKPITCTGVINTALEKYPPLPANVQTLLLAVAYDDKQAVEKLIPEDNSELVNAFGEYSGTGCNSNPRVRCPLQVASFYGYADMIQLLVKKGAKIENCGPDGLTALHMAAWRSKVKAVKTLLELGADPKAKDANGFCPIDYCKYNQGEINDTLKKAGSPDQQEDKLPELLVQV